MVRFDKIVKFFVVTGFSLFLTVCFVYALNFPSTPPSGEVDGGIYGNYFDKMLVDTGATTDGLVKVSQAIGTSTNKDDRKIYIEENGTISIDSHDEEDGIIKVIGNLQVSGEVLAGVHTYTISDKNLKENIIGLENSLDKILKLDGVRYNFIGDEEKSIGLIAQELEKVYPELVNTSSEGIKAVEYGNLVAPLIEAIKEQQEIIDKLEERLEKLEKKY